MNQKDRFFIVLFLSLIIIAALTAHASAGHTEAIDTADKLSKAIASVSLPYERELTMSALAQIGYDTTNMSRPGTYKIRIKSASCDSSTGRLSVNLHAWHNGTSLQTHSPWHFYIPQAIAGTNNAQRLTTFVTILIDNLQTLHYGDPVGDDSVTIYPSVDGMAGENTDTTSYSTIRNDVGDYSDSTADTLTMGYLGSTATTNQWGLMVRGVMSYNTSVIDDNATIDLAILRVVTSSIQVAYGVQEFDITGGTLASNTSIANGDYDGFSSTRFLEDWYTYYDITGPNTYENLTLNVWGRNYIAQNLDSGEFSVLFCRDRWDVDSYFYGTWGPSDYSSWYIYSVDKTGTSYDPFLYIEYTPYVAPTPTPTPTVTTSTPTTTVTTVPYTGIIPNKPSASGTYTPTPTEDIGNWSWVKTGGLIGLISTDLIPELFSSFASFIPFLAIIAGIGIIVVMVEEWIRLMR